MGPTSTQKLLHSKGNNKTKRQPTDWERKFANDMTINRLVSKIYKQLMMLNNIKTNKSINKWAEDLNRHFAKGHIQMAKTHEKMFNITNDYRNVNQNYKTTMRYHLTPARMGIIKKSRNNTCWRGCGEKDPPILLVGI